MSKKQKRLLVYVFSFLSTPAWTFESTKTLPKGVRNVTLRNVQTSLNEKFNNERQREPLAKALDGKALKFKNVVSGEEGVKKTALQAFLLTEGFQIEEALGEFKADIKGSVSVNASIVSYGLTENLTLALALPYYSAKMDVALGFKSFARANEFLGLLASDGYNQTEAAIEASNKLRRAPAELNKKLIKNGYEPLRAWEKHGLGDTLLAAKSGIWDTKLSEDSSVKVGQMSGVVIPTGQTASPDVLGDVPFGSGSWNAFTQIIADQYVRSDVFFNQYAKYTYQHKAARTIRLKTADESIEVGKDRTVYKLGDKFDAGLSVQYEPEFGLVAGLGYNHSRKYADSYELKDPFVLIEWTKNTDEIANSAETRIGYSTVPAFKAKAFPVPMQLSLEFKKALNGKNSVIRDMVTADFAVFF